MAVVLSTGKVRVYTSDAQAVKDAWTVHFALELHNRLTRLMIHPVLAVFQMLNLLTAQQEGNLVQDRDKGIEALQYVQWIVRLRCSC